MIIFYYSTIFIFCQPNDGDTGNLSKRKNTLYACFYPFSLYQSLKSSMASAVPIYTHLPSRTSEPPLPVASIIALLIS